MQTSKTFNPFTKRFLTKFHLRPAAPFPRILYFSDREVAEQGLCPILPGALSHRIVWLCLFVFRKSQKKAKSQKSVSAKIGGHSWFGELIDLFRSVGGGLGVVVLRVKHPPHTHGFGGTPFFFFFFPGVKPPRTPRSHVRARVSEFLPNGVVFTCATEAL
jgi:hypothetical protein